MKFRSPINNHAKFQVDQSTHNENLGEVSNDPEATTPQKRGGWGKEKEEERGEGREG